jgi:formamidopyrimidine-DNA glycosylase
MPELPEVECLAQALYKSMVGQKVIAIDFYRDNLREALAKEDIIKVCTSGEITKIFRRSKYVLFQFQNSTEYLALHLGMSGQFVEASSSSPEKPHTHVVFHLGNQYYHYIDPRRFGRLFVTPDYSSHPFFKNLGVEPLETRRLDLHLANLASQRRQPVKSFLMDHEVVVGVGNIYAAEALFQASISPLKPVNTLSKGEWVQLASSVKDVLRNAIKARGTTFRDYRGADGAAGGNQVNLLVYGREGQTCYECGSTVLNTQISGRSTFYCGGCQH